MINEKELLMLLGDKDVLLYEKEKEIQNLVHKLRDLQGIADSLLEDNEILRKNEKKILK